MATLRPSVTTRQRYQCMGNTLAQGKRTVREQPPPFCDGDDVFLPYHFGSEAHSLRPLAHPLIDRVTKSTSSTTLKGFICSIAMPNLNPRSKQKACAFILYHPLWIAVVSGRAAILATTQDACARSASNKSREATSSSQLALTNAPIGNLDRTGRGIFTTAPWNRMLASRRRMGIAKARRYRFRRPIDPGQRFNTPQKTILRQQGRDRMP